jgi:hypothetical protein
MKSHQFAFFNCQFNFFNELHSVRTLTALPTFLSDQALPWAGIGLPRWGEVEEQNLRSPKRCQYQPFDSPGLRRTANIVTCRSRVA